MSRGLAAKVVARVRSEGFSPTIAYAAETHLPRVWLHETHIWYAVDLDAPRPRPPLPPGFRLLRAARKDLPLLNRLPNENLPQAHERMNEGADLWFVVEADTGEPVFRVWSFYRTAPVTAARGGMLALLPNVVNLEDAVTSPRARGLGVAPAGYSGAFDVIAAEHAGTTMVAKPPEANAPQRRAMEKAGFRPFARQRFHRVGPLESVVIRPYGDGLGGWLADSLIRREWVTGR